MTMAAHRTEGNKELLVSINPATLEEIGTVELMNQEQIRTVIAKAESAALVWGALPLGDRIRYLRAAQQYIVEHIDEIADIISQEMGKPRIEALTADIMTVVDLISYFAKIAPRLLADRKLDLHLFKLVKESKIVYQPLGVVAVIAPWNFPFAIPMSGIVAALLAGNAVVFKPASDVPFIGKKIDQVFKAAGLPDGVFNLILAAGKNVGTTLYEPPIRKVVFTGSTEVGKQIMAKAGENLIPAVMELGGKDPMIVLDDADIDKAVGGALWGACTNAGQVCASVERLYVQETIYDDFVARLTERVKTLRVGAGSDPHTDMGPVVNEGQVKIAATHVEDARKKGATIVSGSTPETGSQGYFFPPTLILNANHQMRCVMEETFGPTLPVMKFKTDEEAISLANDSTYGLTASVWGRNLKRAEKVARQVEAGTVMINDALMSYGITDTPWQGVKESGIGRSHGPEGLLEFTFPKHISIDHTPRMMRRMLWWYPYSQGGYEMFKNAIQSVFGRKGRLGSLAKLLGSLGK